MRSYRGLAGAEGQQMESSRDRSTSTGATKLSGFDRQLADAQRKAEEEEAELIKQREQITTQMMQHAQATDGDSAGKGAVGNLVNLRSDKISSAQSSYEQQQKQIQQLAEKANSAAAQAAAYARKEEALKQQLEEARKEAKSITNVAAEKQHLIDETKSKLSELTTKNAKILEETEKLIEIEKNSDQKDELKKLWSLVQKNERLKKQEKDFKEDCKRKMAALKQAITSFDSTSAEDDEEEIARMKEVDMLYEKTKTKHQKIRQLLAQRNLQVASTSRMIDDIPTRTELIQYERRFVELYQQVALKLEETRKYER